MKVTVIGAGNMGGALIKGWLKAGGVDLTITARSEQTLDRFSGVRKSLDNIEAVKGADIIVIAVKPWMVGEVLAQIKGAIDFDSQTIVSVAANVFCDELRAGLGKADADVVYVMPNIGAEFGESMSFMAPAPGVPAAKTDGVEQLLLKVGKVKRCTEQQVAAGNMLAGCGIAYVMRFIHAMMEGGVEMGLYPADAQAIAMQTMKGAVAVLEGSGLHPAVAIDRVTTPGGLTIRGLNELDHAGFNSAVIRCLKAGLVK